MEGLIIESTGDQTVLHVEIVDQAKLDYILNWLHEQDVDLVRLHPTDSQPRR